MSITPSSLECRLLDASIICYSIQNQALSPSTPGYAQVGFAPGTGPTVFVDGVEGINAGFVGETADGWVIVAYRGTLPPFSGDLWAWVEDWLNDFRAGPMDWTVGNSVIGQVETGFGSAVLNTWGAVQAALNPIDLSRKKGILVTGHSKGAGMTFPAATLLKNLYPHLLVQVCCFAAPLTCDRTFAASYDAMGLSVFTARYQSQYDIVPFLPYEPHFALLASAEQVHCFFEEEAFDAQGRLCVPKAQAINKIGHALHDRDPVFDRFSHGPALHSLATALGLAQPQVWQSQVIFKQPHIGGEVGCHQDATFLYTDPISVAGFWFAIEDATLDNGCLWAEPGGHIGPLRQLFKRNHSGDGTVMERLDDTPLPEPPPSGSDLVPLEVPAGTLIVLNGRLPHWSGVNRSGVSRHAYSLHCISGDADYPDWNWLQRPADMPLRPLG